jgi:hypothetical protein
VSARGKLALAPGATTPSEHIAFPRVGRLVAASGGQPVRVDFEGNVSGPLLPRVAAALGVAGLDAAVRDGLDPVLLFEEGDPARPIVIAVVPSATPLLDAVLAPRPAAPAEARVDGKRVVLEGTTEVILRCGKASIVLRADGQVTVRGTAIRSEARGAHKIRGGKVEIN